jgi:hypothetical protein
MTNLTKCLFHSHSHGNNGEHIGCVTAMRFGRLWLVDDAQTCYWTDQASVDLADDAKYQDGDGYSMWCSDTPMLEYGDNQGTLSLELSAEAAEWTQKIEELGGREYSSLLAC